MYNRQTTNMRKHIILYIGALLTLLSGCQVGPSYVPPFECAPENWKNEQRECIEQDECCYWWEVFDDDMLNALEDRAVNANNDVHAAIERLIQARALAGVKESYLYPQLTTTPSYTNQDILTKIFVARPPIPSFLREHQIGNLLPLNLSYELDLWGQLLSTYQSAYYYAQSQEAALRSLLLVLTADVANSYFHLRMLDRQVELYVNTIKTRKNAVDITRSRYEGKLVNYSDVSRARLDLANVEAQYYDAVRERENEVNRIAVLVGADPISFTLDSKPLQGDPPAIPASMPSQVLQQRPDIASAEREMASQQSLVRVAYANYFPAITLTGVLGYSSPDLTHFLRWKSRFWSLGASALQTVFDAGRTDSQVAFAWASFNEADANYQQVVLNAFMEVENALNDIKMLAKESEWLAESVNAAQTTAQISSDRYYQGVTFYLDVMDSLRDELQAERTFIITQGDRFSATIQLIKALGGTW